MQAYLKKQLIPIFITGLMLCLIVIMTFLLLNKNQVTVQLASIPTRSQPTHNSKRLALLHKNTKVKIIEKHGQWYKIRRPNEQTAWVASWLLTRKKPLKKLTDLAETTIVLDPGHGGSDTGALSNTGAYEKTYTLKTALEVKKVLQSYGANVIITRHTDKIVYLSKIPKIAEQHTADAFISFHYDSAPTKNSASGLTTYYYHKKNGSLALGKALNKYMNNFPMKNKGVDFGDFLVIRDNSRPAVLLEMGYINDDDDFKAIASANYPHKVAVAVRQGLANYFK
ncbi:N-acetylmuramoyl-L-alanine amidase [Periweissella beninensis]|uniref:N-acetylmuramoyl-L-alanine amidase n=1 Tax=Periweissella beninensis TaxID=504936 RepID=A0ABT0VHI3_9LACO|nr:N-acetylmuramoyl-L-alanine amidase [Periweissella beninensis]MBM7543618.1 N-acetylmuramoyl-L-alanine amidase [Periweissella beninensis]MCM2436598.1 N-acetylmuramoyl-L-alanine amidase [Periweissella beninensis]MCT4395447.1 N-acetylmuramoyl-L-alanine amidase [Periweissella beninensis]